MNKIHFLASGSSGNALVVQLGFTRVMVDCGLNEKTTRRLLAAQGMAPEGLAAMLITHEHGDHASGGAWLSKCGVACYASRGTAGKLRYPCKVFPTGSAFKIMDAHVTSFSVPHDAADPTGFVLEGNGVAVGILGDCGHVTKGMVERLKNCTALVLEANHDESMERDSGRNTYLINRVLGRNGHLSNAATAGLVKAVRWPGLKHVALAHLSNECNDPELAKETLRTVWDGPLHIADETDSITL